MNNYFLLICAGDSSPSKCAYKKFLGQNCSIKHQFDASQLLNSIHQAILFSSSSTDEKNDDQKFMWENITRFEEEQLTTCDLNDQVVCHINKLSEAIHALLDQLPVYGSYLLDIFIDGDFFNLLSNYEGEVEIFGALLRCVLWHNGHLTSVHRTKILTHKWADYLRSSELTIQDDVPAVSWRGSLHFGTADSSSSTVIPGLQLHASWHWREHEESLFKNCKEMEHIIVSNEIQVLQEFDVKCLPPYLFSPVKYRLYVPNSCHGCETAKEFFKYLQSNVAIGFIAKLSYATFNGSKGLATFPIPKTEDWKNEVLNSDLKDLPKIPDLQLENSQSIHFVIFWDDSCPPSSAWAIQVRHPSELDTSFCSTEAFTASRIPVSEEVKRGVRELLKDLPWFTPKALQRLKNSMLERRVDFLNAESGRVEDEKYPCLELRLSEFEEEFHSCFKSDKFSGIPGSSEELEKELSPDLDPSDWPERRYLLLRSFNEKTNENLSDPDLKYALDFVAADVLTLFYSSGESIMKDSTNVTGQKICSTQPRNSLDEVLQTSWPDVIHCHYHDIYYNANDAAERKERACNIAREQCILNETASTCTLERPIKQFVLRPSKRKRNDSEIALRRSPRRPALKGSPGNRCTSATVEKSMALRRSPRKHLRKQLFVSSQEQKIKITDSKQGNKGSLSTNQKDLGISELHKKKLREAVVVALETEGISMDNEIFKACGRRLFNVCKAFVSDVIGNGSTSMLMKKIASAHVKQVIEFENLKKETKPTR